MAGKSLNKVMLIGNLGKDADLRYTPKGTAVANFSIATNERFKSGESEEWQERTEWHNIVVWGKFAETMTPFLTKGQKVYVEGRLQTRTWDDNNGQKHYTTEVHTSEIILLGSGKGGGGSQSRPPHPADNGYPAAPTHTGMPQQSQVDDDPPPF